MNQIRVLPFFLLGLPIGLLLLAAISFYFHFREPREVTEGGSKVGRSEEISQERLKKYVGDFASVIGPRNLDHPNQLKTATNYIESTVGPRNLGYEVKRFTYRVGDQNFDNVVFQQSGQQRGDEVILVGAYYDSPGESPGANWNGTGMAALFALAHQFIGSENSRTLRFVAFANGSKDHSGTERDGSRGYAKIVRQGNEKVVGMINLEGLGLYGDDLPPYPESLASYFADQASDLKIISNPNSSDLANEVLQRWLSRENERLTVSMHLIDMDQPYPEVFKRANLSFWEQDYRAVTITASGSFRVPEAWADVPESIDYDQFTLAVKGLGDIIRQLLNP